METETIPKQNAEKKTREIEIRWRNVMVVALYHVIALQGLYYIVSFTAQWRTVVFGFVIGLLGVHGITTGVHRLWSHRTYKANLPLRIILAILQTFCFQNSIYEWARDHRVHHKFTDTDADPHNSTRGFFFSHMGWLLCKKHPDVKLKGKTVDMSDLLADPVVVFQKKYYTVLAPLLCFVLPTILPCYFFNEDWYTAFAVCGMFRYVITLHGTWCVNSVAHIWGAKPYDLSISPADNPIIAQLSLGEGYHNYHHVFPWDYRAAELGKYAGNFSTRVIEFFASIGWAYDLKTTTPALIEHRMLKRGNASRVIS